ncbi:RNA 2',3'-cyclic phosphodiesterase [Azospirillum sp. RWY-5-1]|uniref:RNA 2',3'-cyclic phosphodiesterase n=1 Tax=Azospirillum oleiclasticum TaxID=2735135 RepID=A0ABX2T7N5_9PROT|nr:RNA 2',3'-cyclic phosphodiesterase [Azospirillum oleiclasticum]NYZ13034.1 RNA 2',3'-cyclic phosphodiesterase [Azospirillum oleiclasticum]NYZ20293.1 RNA 2',3'-cyclic phosphodiesterase [Azospirillum oleiclasticum]
MLRLFVALDFPDDIRRRLAGLGGGVPGARWTEEENLHLTLRFIGEVPDDMAGDIDAALAGVTAPAFDLTLDGVGVFGAGRASRVLWAGVERSEPLIHLQSKIESALVRAGLAPEERKFTPHVTLARLKDAPQDRIGRFIAERGLFRAGPFPIDQFTLYRSHLGRTGPVYEAVAEYRLDG